jgi:hypothetical protein
LDPYYKDLYLNAIPALDLKYIIDPNEAKILPEDFSHPLVKCDNTDPEVETSIMGFRSGKRSALVPIKQEDRGESSLPYMRLKGCGNLTLGFNEQKMPYPDHFREIRGVQFDNTAFRELYYSGKMKEILRPYGFVVGNEPVGLWKYSADIDNTMNACPLVPKFCGLYRTYGDKRLATNLIQGSLTFLKAILRNAIERD